MPLYILIPSLIILLMLTITFLALFWKEQKSGRINKYRKGTIIHFIKDGLPIIYILLATIFGLAFIAIIIAGIGV